MGVAEIEESLMAEVMEVYRAYCSQVWSEALNRARVEASSTFRKEKKMHTTPLQFRHQVLWPPQMMETPTL